MARRLLSLTLYFVGVVILSLLLLSLFVQSMPSLAPPFSLGYWPEAASFCFFLSYLILCRPFSRPGRFRAIPDLFLFLSLVVLGFSSSPRWFSMKALTGLWGDYLMDTDRWDLGYVYSVVFASLWVVCFPLIFLGKSLYYGRLFPRHSLGRGLLNIPGRLLGGLSCVCLVGLFAGMILFCALDSGEGFLMAIAAAFHLGFYFFVGEPFRHTWLVFSLAMLFCHALGMALTCLALHRRSRQLAGCFLRRGAALPSLPQKEKPLSPETPEEPETNGDE